MILENKKSMFLDTVKELKVKRLKYFTLNELSEFLNTSRAKLSAFENGKNFDFWLLCRYAQILQEKIIFGLDRKT